MDHQMASLQWSSHTHRGIGTLVMTAPSFSAGSAFGQATNQITMVGQISAARGRARYTVERHPASRVPGRLR